MNKNFLSIAVSILLMTTLIHSQNLFVDVNGKDNNPGSIEQPLRLITSAVNKINMGDTIFIRSGVHSYSSTISINSTKSGNETKRYYLFGYKNERPILDFSSTATGSKGVKLNASYWHIKGIDFRKAGHNGLGITGSNNIIENCTFYENRNTGLQLDNGASNNRVVNCDSYFNYDEHNQGADADGFAPKLTVGTGNYFFGCRAWNNSDDGWDGYLRGSSDITTTLENCWTWGNGYTKTGYDPGEKANGNGFKMGGGDNSNSERLMHHFILKNCLAFNNKAKGFDQNNNDGSMTIINCSGFGNKTANYRITRQVNPGQSVVVKNGVSFQGNVELGNFIEQQTNSWINPFVVTENDFISIDTIGVSGPRKPDGSLPDIQFMHLAKGSDLIDAGTDVGLPFLGSLPDLGAFEYENISSIEQKIENVPGTFVLEQNYPNPFNPVTTINYSVAIGSNLASSIKVTLKVYNILGTEITTLVDDYKQPGQYSVKLSADDFQLSSGIYFYRLKAGSFSQTNKMVIIK